MSFYHRAQYTISAHTLAQLPPDEGSEVAFAGRSNAGKSSAINALTNQKRLARTSKTPGRTQQIIFFDLDDSHRLVDLPGYGYAKVPAHVQAHWQKVLSTYLNERKTLQGLVLMVDSRHPLKEYDKQMLSWCEAANMSAHILLTKADKLSRNQGTNALREVKKYLAAQSGDNSAQLFSATKKTGLDELREQLDRWLVRHDTP